MYLPTTAKTSTTKTQIVKIKADWLIGNDTVQGNCNNSSPWTNKLIDHTEPVRSAWLIRKQGSAIWLLPCPITASRCACGTKSNNTGKTRPSNLKNCYFQGRSSLELSHCHSFVNLSHFPKNTPKKTRTGRSQCQQALSPPP